MQNRKRFPFEIRGCCSGQSKSGMEAIYNSGENSMEEEEKTRIPRYHPHMPACYRRLGEYDGMGRVDKTTETERPASPCRCRETGMGVMLPDAETVYWMNMYPERVGRIQRRIEEECDKMDYEGSMIYDEFPDQVILKRISRNIYEILVDEDWMEDNTIDGEAREIEQEGTELSETAVFFPGSSSLPPSGRPNPPRHSAPHHRPPRPKPPARPGCRSGMCRSGGDWLQDMVDVLLFDEIQRRRRSRWR